MALAAALPKQSFSLKELKLSRMCGTFGFDAGMEILKSISHLTSLEVLELKHNHFGWYDGRCIVLSTSLTQLTSLKQLHIQNNNMDDDTGVQIVNALSKLQNLEHIYLSANSFGEKTAAALLETLPKWKNLTPWT